MADELPVEKNIKKEADENVSVANKALKNML